jgi:hypothetical protein
MKIQLLLTSFVAVYIYCPIFSQSLPKNYHYDESMHQLASYMENEAGFYDLDEIADLKLDFYSSNYWNLLHSYYNTDNYLLASMTYKGEVYDSVGVQFKGQTSYFMAKQQGSTKLSFDIKMGEFVEDQDVEGYSTLNLNNSFDDETFMREVLYGRLAGKHIPAPRGNYVHLYLNGQDWGIYTNIQQVNKDHIEEWWPSNDGIRWRADSENSGGPGGPGGPPPGGQWGDGTAALNYLGEDPTDYQEYYTLKSSDLDEPWSYLIDVCRALNAPYSDTYLDTLGRYLDLDATLWHLATEILFSDDDSYVYKGKMDYSLFYEEETGLMYPLEIDGNSILGNKNLDWGPFYHVNDENYPLLSRLLTIPELRQRYLAHVRTLLEDSFDNETLDQIESLRALIKDKVITDPKTQIPLFKFNQEVTLLKNAINVRKSLISSNAEVAVEGPILSDLVYRVDGIAWEDPFEGDLIEVTCRAEHQEGISKVILYVGTGIHGPFEKVEMNPSGNDFTTTLAGYKGGQYLRLYAEAIADNSVGTRAYYPKGAEHQVLFLQVQAEKELDFPVVINEFMASNKTAVQDQDGEYDDWIELYNNSSETIDLSGYFLSDKSDNLNKWALPEGTLIAGEDYLIVWADENGSEEGLHANFKIAKSGEQLYLLTPEGLIADEVVFAEQETDMAYARVPNGTGDFVIQAHSFAANNDSFSTAENLPDSAWIIYPNPASEYIKFDNVSQEQESAFLKILDLQGNVILEQKVGKNDSIYIGHWVAGMYLVQMDGALIKLIIQ